VTTYIQGSTVVISAEVTNSAGAYIDATTITCTILDPAGVSMVTGAMTKDETGKYHYDYDLDDDATTGTWTGVVKAVISTRTVKESVEFDVENPEVT
jgi:uncharacterized protein YfaS (alpha-2-macroglobulin family)